MGTYRTKLAAFTADSLPDLDTAALGALELAQEETLPSVAALPRERVLVVGSGNAQGAGKLLFEGADVFYADESTYEQVLEVHRSRIAAAVVISASGSKHAIGCAQTLKEAGLSLWLLTNSPTAPAAVHVPAQQVLVFPKNREPYTYNTSTYLGMVLSRTGEDPRRITEHLQADVAPRIPATLGSYDAFYLILPPKFIGMKEMFLTKFDELFGSVVSARAFTTEQSKHAKTVVPSARECFVSFGEENRDFGNPAARITVPLPENAGYGSMLATGYFFIGQVQKQHPPYFKDHVAAYVAESSRLFGRPMSLIVE